VIGVRCTVSGGGREASCNEYEFTNNSGNTLNYTYPACGGGSSQGRLLTGQSVIICVPGGADNVLVGSTPLVAIGGVSVQNEANSLNPRICGSYLGNLSVIRQGNAVQATFETNSTGPFSWALRNPAGELLSSGNLTTTY
jgi:hypothetical protein